MNIFADVEARVTTALEALKAEGVLSESHADILVPAARLYQSLQQVHRLCLEGPFQPETAPRGLRLLLAKAAELPDFDRLEAYLGTTLEAVRSAFDEIIV